MRIGSVLRSARLGMAVAALLGPLAGGAAAVDGVIEINETAVAAGGITPGDGPGYPASLTLPGSYRLTSNLVIPSADVTGIFVTADDVAIDLNGFRILGPARCTSDVDTVVCTGTGGGNGIQAVGIPFPAVRTTVRNGTVRGAGNIGILLNTESAVDFVVLTDNGSGAIIVGNDSLVTRSRIARNGGTGITGFATRIAIADNVVTQAGTETVSGLVTELSGNLCDDQDCSEKRSFYLTTASVAGNGPLTACAAGFHFANFFEIVDPSKLVYDTSRGFVEDDSGLGAPSGNVNRGWVRTGFPDVGGAVNAVGNSQCRRWTDGTAGQWGTTAYLSMGAATPSWPWILETFTCSFTPQVWCVED